MLAVLLVVVAQAAPPKGLGLRELQERARRNDPRTMQVAAQLEAARGKRDEASWVFFPAFQTTAYLAGPTPQRRLIGGDLDPDPTNPAHLKPGSTGGIFHGDQGVPAHVDAQAIRPIWTFGKWTAGKSAAGHLVNASEALLQRARDQAAYDVARAYWGYQTARNADASVQKVRTRLKDAQQTAQKLLAEKSEQISRADSMKLDYLAEEVEAQHASAVKNRDLALTGLRLLVGAQAGEDLPILEQELPQAPQPPNADEILRRALQQRPEARAANEGVAARQALVDLARARLWPDLGIVGGVRLTTTTNADNPASPFVDNPYHESSGFVALGMQWTLDVPQKLARLRQAEGELHEAVAMQVGAEQLARLDVQEAVVTSIAVALIVAAVQPGSASAAVQRTQEKVRSSLNAWFKSQGPARARAREQARKAVGELVDFDALARSTLGEKWEEIKPADRSRYTAALKGAMEANYLAKMRQGKGTDVERIRTEIIGEEQQGSHTVVHTKVHSGEDTAAIDYVMEKRPKGWRAVDVITEGVSLAETYREQVAKILAKKTLNDVIAALDRKRKTLEADENKPAEG